MLMYGKECSDSSVPDRGVRHRAGYPAALRAGYEDTKNPFGSYAPSTASRCWHARSGNRRKTSKIAPLAFLKPTVHLTPTSTRPPLAATLFVVSVAFAFGVGAIFAKLAFNAGSNALSIMTVRTVAALIGLFLLLSWQRVPIAMPAVLRWRALALGVLLCVNTFGMYSAIQHMAAPLAVLVFYTYPVLVTVGESLTGGAPLDGHKLSALALSYTGLALALTTGELTPTAYGIAAAMIASVALTAILMLSGRLFPSGDSRPRTAHMTVAASIVFLIACAVTGEFTLPDSTSGWVGFVGVCISFPLALTGLFIAVAKVGPGYASMLMSFEPLSVLLLAVPFLGETLSGPQWLGAGMVIGAIVLLQYRRA